MTTKVEAAERRWETEKKLLDAIDKVVDGMHKVDGEEAWKTGLLVSLSQAFSQVESASQV
jgi:hypothetical protein